MARFAVVDRCSSKQQKAPSAGLFYRRYWARTSDPQLVDLAQPFAPVRARAASVKVVYEAERVILA